MPRGVPVELSSFVGRRQELAEGRGMLRAARLVTLTGPGGVGKTRLALRLARQVERRFRDGVVVVELAGQHDPASLTSDVAAALGIEPGRSVAEAVEAYLASRELLVVLDNCEHLVEASAELVGWLLDAAPDLRVVATSREPLRVPGEHPMRIEPLAVPTRGEAAAGAVGHIEAVALLADRARAIDPGFRVDASNAVDVSRLCRRLDGIPLAIELAAARLRVLSLGQLVDRLDERFELLTTGPRAALARHQTLRGLVDWSHELCSPAERALWARMSVFQGGADLEAIEAVCGETGDAGETTRDALTGLVEKSVVTKVSAAAGPRYGMLETIREYGLERLAGQGELDAARTRHRDHYVRTARRAEREWFGPDQPAWLDWGAAELGNLRAAFEHALAAPHGRDQALALVASLEWYWVGAGTMPEGLRWTARATEGVAEASLPLLRALVAAMWIAGVKSDTELAISLADRILEMPMHDSSAEVRAHRYRATTVLASFTGDHEGALAAHSGAIANYTAIGDVHRQVEHLETVAVVTSWLGRVDEAASCLEKAKLLCASRGEVIERCEILRLEGLDAWKAGHHEQALGAVREILTLTPTWDTGAVALALELAVRIHASRRRYRSAAVLLGALSHRLTEMGFELGPYLPDPGDASEDRLREELGEAAFTVAFERGRTMTLAEVAAFASGKRSVHAPGKGTLSRREREVAALVAGKFSNKDIAASLGVSVRTAEGHVAKVMSKLGVHSRADLAAWVDVDEPGLDRRATMRSGGD